MLSSVVPQREEGTRAEKAVSFVFPNAQTHSVPHAETHTVSAKRHTAWQQSKCTAKRKIAIRLLSVSNCVSFLTKIYLSTRPTHRWHTMGKVNREFNIHIDPTRNLIVKTYYSIYISVSFMDSEVQYMLYLSHVSLIRGMWEFQVLFGILLQGSDH